MDVARDIAVAFSEQRAPGTPRESLLDLIGNTPLLRLARIGAAFPNVEFYAKAEWFNPGGSVKDRAALQMIREGERSGQLRRDKTVLDATTGNTGIAYAMLGATLGYLVRLCVPASASLERKRTLLAYGAQLDLTPLRDGDTISIVPSIAGGLGRTGFQPAQ